MSSFASVRAEELLPDGKRFVLPRRNWGFLGKLLPVLFVGALLLEAAVFSLWFIPQFQDMFPVALIVVPFALFSLIPLLMVAWIGFGYTIIEVSDGRLEAMECVGPLRRRRSWPVEKIKSLKVVSAATGTSAGVPLSKMAVIEIGVEGDRQRWAAPGYSHEMLLPLANELAQLCNRQPGGMQLFHAPEPIQVELVETESNASGWDSFGSAPTERNEPPAMTNIVCEEFDDGVNFRVPPAGLRKGSRGLFSFSLLWCGFMVIFTPFWFYAGNDLKGMELAFVGGMLTLFWAIGITMLIAAINMGRRQAALAVAGDRLMVLKTGIFGSKTREWGRDEVSTIRVGRSGVEVNNVPVLELQIIDSSGKKFGMLSERDNAELEWIATVLGNNLRLQSTAEQFSG